MKLLFVAPFKPNGRFQGGISSFANYIIERKNDFKNYDIDIVPFSNCPIKRNRYSNGKFSTRNLLNFLVVKRSLKKIIKLEKPDSIYINSSFGLGLLKDLLALKRYKEIKVFFHIHFADIKKILTNNSLIAKTIKKQLTKKVDHIVLLSKKTRNEFIDCGFDSSKLHVLYNYVNPTIKYRNHKKNGKTCLFLGSIDKRKGFYDLINAFKKLRIDLKLIVCGQPNDKDAESCLKCEFNSGWLNYKGFVDGKEKNAILNSADLLILPSYGEGLPISILEAMTCGLAILSTNVGAIPEIVERNGILINPGDTVALTNAITKIMSDKELLNEYQKRSLELSRKYTFDEFKKELIKIVVS